MSLKLFEGFKFSHMTSPVHRLDPRPKFLIALTIFIMSLLSMNFLVLLSLFLVQIPIIYVAKSFHRWLNSIRAGAILASLIFVMNFITGSTLIFSLTMTLRFLVLMSAFSLFFMTTSPDDLGLALEKMGLPYMLSFTFTTAVRLVPTVALEAQTIVDAQRSRGLELDKGGLVSRVRKYIPILIPLIVSAIRRSTELAEALESRAFGVTQKREPLTVLKMKQSDYLVAAIVFLALLIGVYVQITISLPNFENNITMPPIWKFWD